MHIGGKIRYHCSRLITLRSTQHSYVGPTCRGTDVLCIRTPWSIKGGATARRKFRLGESQGPAEDRFIHNQEQYISQWT